MPDPALDPLRPLVAPELSLLAPALPDEPDPLEPYRPDLEDCPDVLLLSSSLRVEDEPPPALDFPLLPWLSLRAPLWPWFVVISCELPVESEPDDDGLELDDPTCATAGRATRSAAKLTMANFMSSSDCFTMRT